MAAVIIEAHVWCFPLGFGLFLTAYLDEPALVSQPNSSFLLPLIGTLSTGVLYLTGKITLCHAADGDLNCSLPQDLSYIPIFPVTLSIEGHVCGLDFACAGPASLVRATQLRYFFYFFPRTLIETTTFRFKSSFCYKESYLHWEEVCHYATIEERLPNQLIHSITIFTMHIIHV